MTQETVKEAYNKLPMAEQVAKCKAYLEYTGGWGLMEAWRESRGLLPMNIITCQYVEGLDSFWSYVQDNLNFTEE